MTARTGRRLLWVLAAATVVLIAAGGTYLLLHQRHQDDIDSRVDRLAPIIWKHAQANALPTELLRAVIRAESGGNEQAKSPRGAKGLMQLTDIAVREVRRTTAISEGDLFDPDYNIRVGAAYLRAMVNKFDGDVYLAVAAYHMGHAELLKARRDHPDPNVTGRQLVEKVASPATIRYCRAVLGLREPRLPVAPLPQP